MNILTIAYMDKENIVFTEFIYCGCGCQLTRPKYDSQGRERKFIQGHNKSLVVKGWKIQGGYKYVRCPPEFSHLALKNGYVAEHRLVWQMEHPEIKLTSDIIIHHKNVHELSKADNKLDNTLENLQNMERPRHTSLHIKGNISNKGKHRKDMSRRRCLVCGSDKTYIRKKSGRPDWYKLKDGYICKNHYMSIYRVNNYK